MTSTPMTLAQARAHLEFITETYDVGGISTTEWTIWTDVDRLASRIALGAAEDRHRAAEVAADTRAQRRRAQEQLDRAEQEIRARAYERAHPRPIETRTCAQIMAECASMVDALLT